MIHIVPILCLILFVLFIEFRLKGEVDATQRRLKDIEKRIKQLERDVQNMCDK